jgi:hypothetical protein
LENPHKRQETPARTQIGVYVFPDEQNISHSFENKLSAYKAILKPVGHTV